MKKHGCIGFWDKHGLQVRYELEQLKTCFAVFVAMGLELCVDWLPVKRSKRASSLVFKIFGIRGFRMIRV